MDDAAARMLAFRFMVSTDQRADAVFARCRRVLGFRGRQRCRVVWADAYELMAVLIAENPLFAARIRRQVAAAERREFDQDREGRAA